MKIISTRYALLGLIVLLALILRLYKIDNPILDWHSFRQADTASVAREYSKHGIDILHPTYHDLGSIQSGFDNLEGYRMVEFPFIQAVIALILQAAPILSLEVTYRFISVLFSLGTLVSLFFLTKKYSGTKVAYVTAFIFAVLPYNVYYSRAILPEPALIFFFTFSVLQFSIWLKKKKLAHFALSCVSLSLSLLLKPFILIFLPVLFAIAFAEFKFKVFKKAELYIFAIVSLIPMIWWRQWILQYPSGIPVSDWLFNSDIHSLPGWIENNPVLKMINKMFGYNPDGLRYRPAWFRWLGYERLTKLMLGFLGIIFIPFAAYKLKTKEKWLYITWWISTILYLIIIARGNVQHDYYQVIVIPILCMTIGRGIVALQNILSKHISHVVSASIIALFLTVSMFIAWQQVSGYFMINHPEYIAAGKAADRLLPKDAKVIAPAFGDTMFLYQTNRTGWPIGFDIETKIDMGATHYISTSYDEEAKKLEEKYFTIEKTPEYILIDLTRERQEQL